MDIEKIANLIKTKRKEKGLTQEELANKLNVTEKAVSRWETKRGTPDISLLVPLSNELGVSLSELLNGKVNKNNDENIEKIINYIDTNKKNKNRYVIVLSSIIYIILLLLYLLYLKIEYNDSYNLSYIGEVFYNTFFITSVYFTNRFIANNYFDTKEDRERMNKISYIIILILYLIMFFNITIYSRFIKGFSYNLIPFKTISKYFYYIESHNIIINVIGNIIILMPVEYLIVKIFNINRFKNNQIISISFSLLIELLQLITKSGVFDIDDIILNVLGMSIVYLIMRRKYKLIYNHKCIIITSLISLIILFISFEILSIYHFGDIPTSVVIVRLVLGFIIIETILYFIYKRKR